MHSAYEIGCNFIHNHKKISRSQFTSNATQMSLPLFRSVLVTGADIALIQNKTR